MRIYLHKQDAVFCSQEDNLEMGERVLEESGTQNLPSR